MTEKFEGLYDIRSTPHSPIGASALHVAGIVGNDHDRRCPPVLPMGGDWCRLWDTPAQALDMTNTAGDYISLAYPFSTHQTARRTRLLFHPSGIHRVLNWLCVARFTLFVTPTLHLIGSTRPPPLPHKPTTKIYRQKHRHYKLFHSFLHCVPKNLFKGLDGHITIVV